MKHRVFIDGREGTTGLQIYDRLGSRDDIELITLSEESRKDPAARASCINGADIVFLCLPDDAARESVAMVKNPDTRVIDASTAHRTADGWVYGFPELNKAQRERIRTAPRVANPGCHATGIIAAAAPLIDMGIIARDHPVTCFSLTGYSGGGKSMIAEYEADEKAAELYAPRIYGLGLKHKHLPEMTKFMGLTREPVFCPVVDDYYTGMETVVMLHNDLLLKRVTAEEIYQILSAYYDGECFIRVSPFMGGGEIKRGFAPANANVGTNILDILVCGREEQTIIISRFDNLGKGASGAAVQNMNIMLGLHETAGLI